MYDLPLKSCLRVHYITGCFVTAESGSRINKEMSADGVGIIATVPSLLQEEG
jgi:hypothetical protein